MEASAQTAKAGTNDRELALRLGSLMLHLFNAGSGSVFRPVDEAGLSFVQTKALLTFASPEQVEPGSVKLLAEHLGISLPSASRAVEELVQRGLVTRQEDPVDRRVKRVELTGEGREIADRVMAARLEGLERFAASLNAEERRKLDAALDVLLEREEIATTYQAHRRRERSR
jgi:DNA-binding MarR family transcriptional regulator